MSCLVTKQASCGQLGTVQPLPEAVQNLIPSWLATVCVMFQHLCPNALYHSKLSVHKVIVVADIQHYHSRKSKIIFTEKPQK